MLAIAALLTTIATILPTGFVAANSGFESSFADPVIAQSVDSSGEVTDIKASEVDLSDSISTAFYSPNPNDCILPALIFGEDDRTILPTNMYNLFPYRTVCLIHAYFGTTVYAGTGVLVGPSTVLTCSHLLYNDGWPSEVRVYPAAHQTDIGLMAPYGTFYSENSVYPAAHQTDIGLMAPYGTFYSENITIGVYFRTSDPADGWAIVDLDYHIGQNIGYMGVSSPLSNGDDVRLYGYHGDLNARLAYGPGEVTSVETFKFRHNCDAISDSSGGPVTTNWSTVVGIHHGGYNNNWDQACKVSDYIVTWIEERIIEA